MAERGESSGRGSQFNIATIIALLTAAAGILVVSKKLTSDRPLSSSERPVNPKEDQTVEARLWEDPFKWKPEEAQATNYKAFALLQTQIVVHAQSSPPYILAVMVGGGTYSEDIEGRIRSRFAIVSALEEAHYKPESAEHLGAVLLPSPSARPLLSWLKDTNSAFQIADDEFDDRTNVLKCDDR